MDEWGVEPFHGNGERVVDDSVAEGEEWSLSDTNACQARNGRDIQGIQWDRLHFTRESYRKQRLADYKNWENLEPLREAGKLYRKCTSLDRSAKFYSFHYNATRVKSTIVHFQLRNLVACTSKHDVYVMHEHVISHWYPVTRRITPVLNLASKDPQYSHSFDANRPQNSTVNRRTERTSSTERNTDTEDTRTLNHFGSLGPVQISTMNAGSGLLIAGGFHGEMVVKNLYSNKIVFGGRITCDDNAITNALDIYNSSSGALVVSASNNDKIVRIFDATSFQLTNHLKFPWAVNHTSISPSRSLMCVVGDDKEGKVVAANDGSEVAVLKGHLDYSFASAWHPGGHLFATGNQDMTCRVWDIRQTSESLAIFKGRMGAVRSLHFSEDGKYLAMAEPADFVHLIDCEGPRALKQCQEIDLFGEVAGVAFSPDGSALFVGISDRTFGSLLEYERREHNPARRILL